nr:MAG TPA: hypothetical protein [Bacteriophage sp.]
MLNCLVNHTRLLRQGFLKNGFQEGFQFSQRRHLSLFSSRCSRLSGLVDNLCRIPCIAAMLSVSWFLPVRFQLVSCPP